VSIVKKTKLTWPRPAGGHDHGKARRPWLSLIVLCLGTFAVLLDATIVNVALPSIITDLHASLDQALWVVNAYLLVFAGLLIVAGQARRHVRAAAAVRDRAGPVRGGLGAVRGPRSHRAS
jgi:hypothetical protein